MRSRKDKVAKTPLYFCLFHKQFCEPANTTVCKDCDKSWGRFYDFTLTLFEDDGKLAECATDYLSKAEVKKLCQRMLGFDPYTEEEKETAKTRVESSTRPQNGLAQTVIDCEHRIRGRIEVDQHVSKVEQEVPAKKKKLSDYIVMRPARCPEASQSTSVPGLVKMADRSPVEYRSPHGDDGRDQKIEGSETSLIILKEADVFEEPTDKDLLEAEWDRLLAEEVVLDLRAISVQLDLSHYKATAWAWVRRMLIRYGIGFNPRIAHIMTDMLTEFEYKCIRRATLRLFEFLDREDVVERFLLNESLGFAPFLAKSHEQARVRRTELEKQTLVDASGEQESTNWDLVW